VSPAELVARAAGYGWAVELRDGPRLVRADPLAGKLPTPLVDALRRNREAVVAWLTTCGVCGADVSDDETRARLADPLFCSRGGGKAVVDGNGVAHPEARRCPYKPAT